MVTRPERRSDDRLKEQFTAYVRVTGPQADQRMGELPALVTDVGSGGMKVHTHEILARGWRLRVRIVTPPPALETIEITAEVAWSRHNALDLHGRCTSGLVYAPQHQASADRLLGMFLVQYLPPPGPLAIPPVGRLEALPPLY